MKLGLLLALAVAAVVPGLSHGRNVTDCELRQTLATALALPAYLQRYKESILAAVICNVKRISQLNSGLITVKGTRTTTPPPTTTETTPALPTDTTTPELPMDTTTPELTTDTTTPELTTDTSTPALTTDTTTPALTTDTTTPELTTDTSTAAPPAVAIVKKRAAPLNIRELNMLDKALKQLVQNGHVSLFNEDDYKKYNRIGGGDSSEEDHHEEDHHEEDHHEEDHHEEDHHEEDHGGTQPSSLGFYGLFQLSDGYFCDSGFRPSKNVCGTDCSAFADDNITDDVACLVNTNYWWSLLENAPGSCFNTWAFLKQVSSCGV